MSPQQCTVCQHSQTKEIEKQIVEGKANTQIARKFDLDHQAIRRHAKNHLPRRMVLAKRREQREHTENILDHLDEIIKNTKDILDDALEKGEKTTALKAIREARNNMTFLAQIQIKQKEYAREDEERQDRQADRAISKGLESLTTEELKTLLYLQAKVGAADPNYIADPTARMVIDYVNSDRSGYPHTTTDIDAETVSSTKNNNKSDSGDESSLSDNKRGSDKNSDSETVRNHPRQHKNRQNPEDEGPEMIDDLDGLDLDDLDLTDDNTIPSEETDPDWLREERRKKRRRRGF